jgi:hypothetical protein
MDIWDYYSHKKTPAGYLYELGYNLYLIAIQSLRDAELVTLHTPLVVNSPLGLIEARQVRWADGKSLEKIWDFIYAV